MLLLLEEVDVSRGDDAHQAPAHLPVVSDGDATEAVPRLGLEDVPHALVWAHHHGVGNEALLVPLWVGRGGEEHNVGERRRGREQGRRTTAEGRGAGTVSAQSSREAIALVRLMLC